jgi:hypothetical protein
LLVGPLDAGLDLEHRVADLGQRGVDVDRDALAQPLAQVGVQRVGELAGSLVGRADGEVLELLLAVHPPRHLGRVTHVLRGEGVDVVLRVAPLALAPRVVVAGQLVEQLGPFDELTELEHEHARLLAVGEEHAEAVELLHDALELTDGRQIVDDELVAHRHRQLDDAPEPVRAAREEHQPLGARAIEATAHERADARQVVGHRSVAVDLVVRGAHEPVELSFAVLDAPQSAAVDVEVARGHGGIVALEPGELPYGGLIDRSHGILLGRRQVPPMVTTAAGPR